MQPLISLFLPSPETSALNLCSNMAQHLRQQQDKHHHKFSFIVLLKKRGNKQTTNVNFVQHTGTFSFLTTPERLEGESGQPVVKQWHRASTQSERKKREEKRRSEREKAREKVKYLPLLSNTSYNSWAMSSRVASCFRGLSSHRGDGWWGLLFLTFKVCHNTSCSPPYFRHCWATWTSGRMCVCCCKTTNGKTNT